MMKLKIILLNIGTIFLVGCCKTCVIQEKLSYPDRTRSGIKYSNDAADASRVAWWTKLHDPALNALIMQALLCNNQIKSAYETIKQAQSELKAAQYAWVPTLDANAAGFAGGTWNSHLTPTSPLVDNAFFSNFSHTRFRGYYAGFLPGYTFNILNIINNVKAAKATLAVEQAQAQLIKLSIISQMSGTYFMLLSQRAQLAMERTLRTDLRKLRQLEQVRFQKGANDIETMLTIDQQLAQEDAQIPQIESIVAKSENTIRLLLNQNPGPIRTHRNLLALDLTHMIPNQLPSSVLKNRPDIMIALNNVNIAYAQIGIAYSVFFPTIALTSFIGGASLDLIHLLKLSTNIWIAEAAASMKIFNLSSYQNIKSAKAGLRATYYNYLDTVHRAFADVDNTLTNAQKNKLSYVQTQKGVVAAKKTYDIAAAQYRAGAKDYRNVVNAKINLDRTQLNLIQAKAQLLDSIVQVYNAVAGGYAVDLLQK